MGRGFIEGCVDSHASALAVCQGGADRLELCANLVIGGTTPSHALFRQVRRDCGARINVLIRPRFGDFLYSEGEFAVLHEEVRLFCSEGANGLVFGLLTPDGALDEPRMAELMALAGGVRVTLHRAFDMCADPFAALETARRLGVHTILTSGQQNSCSQGFTLLRQLLQAAGDCPEILVGSGVNAAVIRTFYEQLGVSCFHLSGKTVLESGMRWRNPAVSMGAAGISEYTVWRTDAQTIREAANTLQSVMKSNKN